MSALTCRHCNAPLTETFVDLGMSPLSNAYIAPDRVRAMEPFYPLHAFVCGSCMLVQLPPVERPEVIFSDHYAYFASYSDTWLEHCRVYAEAAIARFSLRPQSRVVEIGSNDGCLLQYFHKAGITVLGVEPAANVAEVAVAKGIPTKTIFFGSDTAHALKAEGHAADLLIGNNVLAHVPDLNGFVAGLKTLLRPDGVVTMEFPHLLQLIQGNQFDTIYHEHFSYFSLLTAERVFKEFSLTVFDVDQLPTHGGSLRIYARHSDNERLPVTAAVSRLLDTEKAQGLGDISAYCQFSESVRRVKRTLLTFLVEQKNAGRRIVGYGAPAKGNTLLNYCGVRTDFLDYTVDRSPHKQGHFLPGTHIPIHAPEVIARTKPDFVLILPWNLKDEIMQQMSFVRAWGGRFVVPIPGLQVL
jgi:SAM-dependent methyltransferase